MSRQSQHPPSAATPHAHAGDGLRERREHFRVTDRVDFAWRPVPSDALEGSPEDWFEDAAPLATLRHLRQLDHDTQGILRRISDNDRDIGHYFKAVNRKLDILAAGITALAMAGGPRCELQVSLSEGGMSLLLPTSLPPGETLAMRLILLPSHLCICSFATVVACQPRGADGHQISLRFERLEDASRKLLARHVLHRQAAERKQSNEQTAPRRAEKGGTR